MSLPVIVVCSKKSANLLNNIAEQHKITEEITATRDEVESKWTGYSAVRNTT